MLRQRLPEPWCEALQLDDGRRLVLRPIAPADAEPLRAGFALLSPEEVRMRFLHPMRELSPAYARQLSDVDRRNGIALVVAEDAPPGEALIGAVARAVVVTDEEAPDAVLRSRPVVQPRPSAPREAPHDLRRAEFAIIVSRFLARKGLGRLLMRKLVHWARLKRLDELYGDVLEDNIAMLALARAMGFRVTPHPSERGLLRVRLALRG